MICPNCKEGRAITSDSRCVANGSEVYRRRKCEKCGYVIFTAEFEVEYEGEFKRVWNDHKNTYNKKRRKTKEEK